MSPTDYDQTAALDSTPEAVPDEPQADEATKAAVNQWLTRIECAKARWEPDFKRMRENMEFVSGLQWAGQSKIDDERYINNLTLRLVNQKVATLYAKDPQAVATARERMYFQIWDENIDTLLEAINQSMMIQQAGHVLPPEIGALMQDYQTGKQRQALVERVGRTLKIVYQYQVDTQKPEFKEQMKQVVRRAIICGVAYGRPIFCSRNENYKKVSTVDVGSTVEDRLARLKSVTAKAVEQDTPSPHIQTLQSLLTSLGGANEEAGMPERIEFDFPCATSIIPDDRCRNLKGFTSARWIAQEYVLPVDEVNTIFGTNIKVGSSTNQATERYQQTDVPVPTDNTKSDPQVKGLVSLYEVFDYTTRTRFFVCKGWPDFVLPPEKPYPDVAGFWQHFSLVFNDVEVESGCRTSLFPPSDVQIVKSPQKEWNRTREALRAQRNANAPKYVVRKGMLTENDVQALKSAEPNSVIELEGVPVDQPIDRFILPLQFARIDPALYDVEPLQTDILMGGGMQEANLGPAQPNVTATVGTIAEQSRLNVSGSNVDDLDSFLSCLAQASGEMLLKGMSKETAIRIAGEGASWPDLPENRINFVNEVFLRIEAASSGRPNKAIDIANFRDLVPLLLQAGANPAGVVEEGVRRLGDSLDVDRFFPLLPRPQAAAAGQKEAKPGAGPANLEADAQLADGGGEARRLDFNGPPAAAISS